MKAPIFSHLQRVLLVTALLLPLALAGQSEGGGDAAPSGSRAQGGLSDGGRVSAVVGANYVIKPSDIIEVSVYNEQDLRQTVRVESDNTISLPLIGAVRVGEMTVSEAKELITRLYDRDYIVNPQVSILVLEFSSEVVRVLGAVNSPGIVMIPPDRDLMLTDAIAQVNGISRIGNSRSVQVRRVERDGTTRVLDVNFDQILGDPNARDLPLRDGDTIFVRERIF